jgi:hypothetical protein
MSEEIKYIDIIEFREKGYLQEVNRRFFHPLGLALEVVVEADGTERLGRIWDYREDSEGIYYDFANRDDESVRVFKSKKEFIDNEFMVRSDKRMEKLGFIVEDI